MSMCRANNIGAAGSPDRLCYSAGQYHESYHRLYHHPGARWTRGKPGSPGALQVIAKELWLVTAWQEPPDDAPQPASDP